MKSIMRFVKNAVLGGFFVLLPIVLLYLVIDEMLELVVVFATPIADVFPKEFFDETEEQLMLAVALILGTSFVIGLVMYSEIGRRLGSWFERTVLDRVPMYSAMKKFTTGFSEARQCGAFKPATLVSSGGHRELVYVVEDHGDGQLTVLVPWAPMPIGGPVKIVGSNDVEMLDAKLGDVITALSEWGMGVRDILGKAKTQ
jgi:uncharacterized membrane protein